MVQKNNDEGNEKIVKLRHNPDSNYLARQFYELSLGQVFKQFSLFCFAVNLLHRSVWEKVMTYQSEVPLPELTSVTISRPDIHSSRK